MVYQHGVPFVLVFMQELAADAYARSRSPAPLLLPADEKEQLEVLRQHIAELEAERARRGALNFLYPQNLLTRCDPHAQRHMDLTMLLTDLRSAHTILSGGHADGDDGGDSPQGSPLTDVDQVSTYACTRHSNCTGTHCIVANQDACPADRLCWGSITHMHNPIVKQDMHDCMVVSGLCALDQPYCQ
jgi:hypothetical protein